MSDYAGGWFGQSWGAPACDPARHRPTPVGALCDTCEKPVGESDQGMLIPHVSGAELYPTVALLAYHLDCFLSMIVPKGVLDVHAK